MIEEADIELWYEEQKQNLSEQYMKSIAKGMSVDDRERHFNRAMEKLNADYERRHTKYLAMLERRKNRSALFNALGAPFSATWRGMSAAMRFISNGMIGAFKENYAQVHFTANMAHIHHTHKIVDGTASFFRPYYYFYAKHLQMPLIMITRPFTNFFKSAKLGFIQMREAASRSSQLVWNYTKLGAKGAYKHLLAAQKKAAAKSSELSKRYHEAQSKRVQAHLDRKNKKKEEKEKRLKETGAESKAEKKNLEQTDAASTV